MVIVPVVLMDCGAAALPFMSLLGVAAIVGHTLW